MAHVHACVRVTEVPRVRMHRACMHRKGAPASACLGSATKHSCCCVPVPASGTLSSPLPKLVETGERLVLAIHHLPRLIQQVGVKGRALDAACRQRVLDLVVADLRWLRASAGRFTPKSGGAARSPLLFVSREPGTPIPRASRGTRFNNMRSCLPCARVAVSDFTTTCSAPLHASWQVRHRLVFATAPVSLLTSVIGS